MAMLAQIGFAWIGHYILPFVLMITPIVFFHELGHFLVARACGVRVDTFSIGFGPAIVSWHDRKKTLWKISWIPLGGYVKFLGDASAASVPDTEGLASMSPEERAEAFPLKPLWQRALVVVAGPVANFILAIAIFAGFLMIFGEVYVPPVVNAVVVGSPAAAAGIRPGDKIVSIDGDAVSNFDDIRPMIQGKAGENIPVVVQHSGSMLTLHVTPRTGTEKLFGSVEQVVLLGIQSPQLKAMSVRRFGPGEAIIGGIQKTWSIVRLTFDFAIKRFTFQVSSDQIRGPVGIWQASVQVASVSWLYLVQLAALLSVSVGLINLFPIPVLDGGHLLYYGCEAVLGRPLGARAQDVGFRLGLALILGLFLFATWNDVARLLKP